MGLAKPLQASDARTTYVRCGLLHGVSSDDSTTFNSKRGKDETTHPSGSAPLGGYVRLGVLQHDIPILQQGTGSRSGSGSRTSVPDPRSREPERPAPRLRL